uniref:Uncharacterized protein n=1 Tax=Mimivirus LCMiAC02 TaxID=2506609 RepID=A0A4P6VQ33_9VIRU|nr:MAG: hypothetical protein LCMiAC02_04790 [Mimivirus LCMiAC02]
MTIYANIIKNFTIYISIVKNAKNFIIHASIVENAKKFIIHTVENAKNVNV